MDELTSRLRLHDGEAARAAAEEFRAVGPDFFSLCDVHLTRATVHLSSASTALTAADRDEQRRSCLAEFEEACRVWQLDHRSLRRLRSLCEAATLSQFVSGAIQMACSAARSVAAADVATLRASDIAALATLEQEQARATGVLELDDGVFGLTPQHVSTLTHSLRTVWVRRSCYRVLLSCFVRVLFTPSLVLWAREAAAQRRLELPIGEGPGEGRAEDQTRGDS